MTRDADWNGLTEEDASMPANQLLGVGISALSKDYCNEQFGARERVFNTWSKVGLSIRDDFRALKKRSITTGRFVLDTHQGQRGVKLTLAGLCLKLMIGNQTVDFLVGIVSFGVDAPERILSCLHWRFTLQEMGHHDDVPLWLELLIKIKQNNFISVFQVQLNVSSVVSFEEPLVSCEAICTVRFVVVIYRTEVYKR